MRSSEIRSRFIKYFVKNGHVEVPSSSVVPERHPTLLFVNSGMIQFIPYFLGEKDPIEDFGSARLCSVQKSIRTVDLDKIGKSKYHLTFFEMLGSWSIGDYDKKQAVEYAHDLLTDEKYGFGLDEDKLYVTVFCGNDEVGCDQETIDAWKSVGIPEERIPRLPASENWWAPAGPQGPGPCGPCTEVLYDRGPKYGPEEEIPGLTGSPRYLEIWNAGVFIQYNRGKSGQLNPLGKMTVDTGAGLERITLLLQNVDSVYETDLFIPIVDVIKSFPSQYGVDFNNPAKKEALWRVSDHVKAITFIAVEGVYPSNKEQGYVLRKLIRTAFNDLVWRLGIDSSMLVEIIPSVSKVYEDVYPEVGDIGGVVKIVKKEHDTYKRIADNARRYKRRNPNATPFDLYQSAGAPKELIKEIFKEFGEEADFVGFDKMLENHRRESKEKSGKRFAGGLGDSSDKQVVKLHTATHLLHRALRDVLGDHVQQMGSNITHERLRFDFSHHQKLTSEELQKVEDLVNQKIDEALPVKSVTLPRDKAERSGAFYFSKGRYGERVRVYYIGKDLDTAWSKEFCGGPHVRNTRELGAFKIFKEESVGKGTRRIKAVVN